jgi:hypothetical protein
MVHATPRKAAISLSTGCLVTGGRGVVEEGGGSAARLANGSSDFMQTMKQGSPNNRYASRYFHTHDG